VVLRQPIAEKQFPLPQDPFQFILLPIIARRKYKQLIETYESLKLENRLLIYNTFKDGKNRELGIIACGIAYNYLIENLKNQDDNFPILRISAYPISKDTIKDITDRCKSVLILEEGAPMLEESIRGILDEGIKVYGRMDGTLPYDGELNPSIVAKALGIDVPQRKDVSPLVKNRPPSFCKGCGHADMYLALNEAIKPYENGRVFSDIGCYTLGALPPYNSIHSCVDLGAAVTMAVGAAEAGLFPSVCVIGDSTFTHSGITGLLDAVVRKTSVTIIIADNFTVGMTGGQDSHAEGRLKEICIGMGVDPKHIREVVPLPKNHEEHVRIIKEEIEFNGVSVIISVRECIQTAIKSKKQSN
jgi:indolepyruvate ferredoxin oxidoreductase alpha subunit